MFWSRSVVPHNYQVEEYPEEEEENHQIGDKEELTVTMGGGSCSRLVLEAKLAVQLSGTHDTILLQSLVGL